MKRGPWHGISALQRWWRLKRVGAQPNALLTPFLLVLLLLLLVGLASTLPPLPPASPPGIFTSVAYSTLVSEARAGRILAIHLQGTALNGLRRSEPSRTRLAKQEQSELDQEVADFLGCLPEVTQACFDTDDEPRFPRGRLLYTLVPEQEQARLVALLLSCRVVVSIARPSAPPWWAPLIWKVGPIFLLFLFILFEDWDVSMRQK